MNRNHNSQLQRKGDIHLSVISQPPSPELVDRRRKGDIQPPFRKRGLLVPTNQQPGTIEQYQVKQNDMKQ